MSNVKFVGIEGLILAEIPNHEGLSAYLGKFCHPMCGINIKFGDAYKRHQGKVMLDYSIIGEEAVSIEFLNKLVKDILDSGGTIDECSCFDVDDKTQYDLVSKNPLLNGSSLSVE